MLATRPLVLLALLALLSAALGAPRAGPARGRARRQLADDDALQPLEDADSDEQTREKRKLEGLTQAKFGIKNAVLGFVFGKINSLIDAKTRLVDTLDKKNIELNKQYGIEAPQNGLASLSGVVGQVVSGIGPKLQLLGPKIQAFSGLFGGSSGASSGGGGGGGGQGGSGLGSILSLVTSLSGSSSGGGAAAGGTVETIDSSEEDDSVARRGGAGRGRRAPARRGRRRLLVRRAGGARGRPRLRPRRRRRRTTSRCSTATRSAWTCRGACLGRPCPCSSVLLRSSATSYRTPRCATRRSCGCSGRCSAASSRSRAWTRPPPPPPRRRAPPPPQPGPAARAPLTTKCGAADTLQSATAF